MLSQSYTSLATNVQSPRVMLWRLLPKRSCKATTEVAYDIGTARHRRN